MGRRPFDTKTVKSLSQFGLGQSRADAEAEEKLKKEAELRETMTPYRVSSSDVGQGFSMEEGLNPWEISSPEIPAVLICPTCSVDVEEVKEPPAGASKPMGELVAGSYPEFKSAFCYCPKCGTNYFQVELVKMKSWRREFPKDGVEDGKEKEA